VSANYRNAAKRLISRAYFDFFCDARLEIIIDLPLGFPINNIISLLNFFVMPKKKDVHSLKARPRSLTLTSPHPQSASPDIVTPQNCLALPRQTLNLPCDASSDPQTASKNDYIKMTMGLPLKVTV